MPKLRAIGLSMFAVKDRANIVFKAGAGAYLSKRFSVGALTAAIGRCTGTSELGATPR